MKKQLFQRIGLRQSLKILICIAALFGCAVTSAFGAVNNDANLKIGQSVLIFGIGGMGLNIAYAASLVSAYPIIGVDLHREKIELGKKYGLTHGLIAIQMNSKIKLKKFLIIKVLR